ncbi:MAG: hypothetical protein M0C28_42335 [Candidatus Moduliflexus flocculans]|nr:hypothetical protein [Candidatus Moduliflexus flocculans]
MISNASCTTNCLAPVVKVLHESFGVEQGPHDDHPLLHQRPEDPRRARTRTCAGPGPPPSPRSRRRPGAAKAVGLVMPELKGKIDGFSVRVPTPDVSIVDFVAVLKKTATAEEINAAFKAAAAGPLKGILGYTDEPLVSVRLPGRPPLGHRRPALDQGHRRQPGQGHRLVRQRVGLLLPARRPGQVHRQVTRP